MNTSGSQIHYQVNNKQFFNVYLAYYESQQSGCPVEFYCREAEYDRYNWAQEPEQDFETLMDVHAINLRQRYEKLILSWSGGTDSQTMYNVFKRNQIHIDEIVVYYDDTGFEPHMPEGYVAWIQNNHWDPTTVITAERRFNTDAKKLTVTNEDWIFENKSTLLKFASSHYADAIQRYLQDTYAGTNWAFVNGLEKPSMHEQDGVWYARQSDDTLNLVRGIDRIECFFLEPMLIIKQSHMAKRVIKQWRERNPGSTQRIDHPTNKLEYQIWAKILGRHSELHDGVSYAQKSYNQLFAEMHADFLYDRHSVAFDRVEGTLKAMLQNRDPVAQNYVHGIYNLQSERDFYEFVLSKLERKGNAFKKLPIWSKPYCLGE